MKISLIALYTSHFKVCDALTTFINHDMHGISYATLVKWSVRIVGSSGKGTIICNESIFGSVKERVLNFWARWQSK